MSKRNPLKPRFGASQRQSTTLRNTLLIGGLAGALILAGILATQSTDSTTAGQAFTNVAISGSGNAGTAAAVSGNKDGGFAWGDINADGYLDMVVNTDNSSKGTRILIANATDPANPYFEDKTTDYCNHCKTVVKERCAILADINHDGYIDLVRNTSYDGTNGSIVIYLNQGPSGNYELGTGSNNDPNNTIQSADFHDSKMNTEGVFLADYDNDGWLDLIVENHNYGIDIFQNPKDGTAAFTCLAPSATGLPASATDGDYGTCVDFDDDGDVDIIARKRNENDFFVNDGDGTFTDGQNIDDANNGNKGGVAFGDFDNDGDYDLYWTDNGTNQIWLNDGTNALAATQSGSDDGEPWHSAGVSAPSSGIDGVSIGDVNNDGKSDLFLTSDNGTSYLFINNTPNGGSLSFTQDNLSINVNGNGEGAAFADYDKDGDLDLYVNIRNGSNQLWRNNLNDGGDANYLFVEPRIDLGSGVYRAAIGANIVLQDCNGNVISGIREVPTTSGHGTDAPDCVHFGLPDGPDQPYNVIVKFVTTGGSRVIISRQITPSELSNQTLVVYDTESNVYGRCSDQDQDEIPNWLDLDDDKDGISDIAEIYTGDHDNDGTPDYADAQFCSATFTSLGWDCSAGLPDPSADLDEDGIVNYADSDFPGCGSLINGLCANYDMDQDGIPNHLDVDSDNDAIPDLVESGGTDVNGDGQVDIVSSGGIVYIDENGNGTKDAGETTVWDQDDDGWLDTYDDTGNSYTGGTPITLKDTDGDGIHDHIDLDSDNDGIPDVIEIGGVDTNGDGMADGGADSDLDGFNDAYDQTDSDPESTNDASFASSANTPFITTHTDDDGDAIVDDSEGYTGADTDTDAVLNHLDLDADNDGIPDIIESGGVDSDGDGRVDDANPGGSLTADTDEDGFSDTYDPDLNNDGDTNDAGDTGLPMIITSTDGNNDGQPASYPAFDNDNSGVTANASADADGDNIPNFLDLDADNDGIPDIVEVGLPDNNGDGKAGNLNVDGTFTSGNDADTDGFHDSYDPDDNTTSTDENQSTQPHIKTVASGSGTANGHPALPDVAGKSGLMGGMNADFDGDGIPNYLDLDADNDGISDAIETFGSSADATQDGQVDNQSGNDGNSNGWHNSYEGLTPTITDASTEEYSTNNLPDYETGQDKPDYDADGLPNYLDIDADNDGIVDLIEVQASSINKLNIFDGLDIAGAVDQDYDGLADEVDTDHGGTYLIPQNHDGIDNPDFLDLDTDNDGFPDSAEGHDGNMDGITDNAAAGTDADRDGLDDSYDTDNSSADPSGSNQSIQDEDNDMETTGNRDWRDIDSSTFPVEWLSFTANRSGDDAHLTWATASELNSDYYLVERSLDGNAFQAMGQVSANGTTQERSEYTFTDPDIVSLGQKSYFYRLKQVDLDGSFEYSNVEELRLDDSGYPLSLLAYPNPATDFATLRLGHNGKAEVRVLNVSGQVVFRQDLPNPNANQEIQLPVSTWGAGTYIIHLVDEDSQQQQQLIVR